MTIFLVLTFYRSVYDILGCIIVMTTGINIESLVIGITWSRTQNVAGPMSCFVAQSLVGKELTVNPVDDQKGRRFLPPS